MRLSPDDVHIIYERPIRVPWGEPAKLTAATPQLSFPEAGTLQVEETISNDAAAGRAGLCFYYEVFKGRDYLHGGVVHPLFCYAAPGETVRHTVKFRALEAGEEYTLYVRRGWGDICHTLHFTVPSPTSISIPTFPPTTMPGKRKEINTTSWAAASDTSATASHTSPTGALSLNSKPQKPHPL